MKKISIFISILLILSIILYALKIISDSNVCTGVRKYECQKKINQNIQNPTVIDLNLQNNLLKISDIFSKGHNTKFSKIDSSSNVYRIFYVGADNLEVDISKDNNWVEKVIINGNELSRNQINSFFDK